MNPRSRILRGFVLTIFTFSFWACSFTVQKPNALNTPTSTLPATEAATATLQSAATATLTVYPTPTTGVSLTPTFPPVTITAVNGNLYIRRGSGSDFNPIGVLEQGQTAAALGRDILNKWLYIPIPSTNGKFGWVSTLTIYSSIRGSTMELPVVDSPLAVPAFIQNCSLHNMIIQPSGVVIPNVYQFPDNIVRFDPGEYSIHDYDLVKNPEIVTIDLQEGENYQITANGTSAHHKCPLGQ
jgi:hypothetical protein